jgi:predicted PurR-regulated permease PerM
MLGFDVRAARITWTVSLVLLALYAAYSVRRTLFVFVLAVFFSYVLYPAVRSLERMVPRRMSRTASTAFVFVLLVLVLAGLAAAIGPLVAEQSSRLAEQLPALVRDPHVLDRLPLPDWLAPFRSRGLEFLREQIQTGTSLAIPLARRVGETVVSVVGNALFVILIPILAFLFIKDGRLMRNRFLDWTASGRRGSMWQRIVDDLDALLGRFIRALLILSLATFVANALLFSVAGVPYGVLLALVAAVLEFIPVIGPLVAAIGCVVVAGLSGYGHLLLLAGFIGLYRLFQDYVLNPTLMSGGVALPPLLVLFGLLAGEELAGVAGIFLSVPVLAAAKIAILRIAQERRLAAVAVADVAPESLNDQLRPAIDQMRSHDAQPRT